MPRPVSEIDEIDLRQCELFFFHLKSHSKKNVTILNHVENNTLSVSLRHGVEQNIGVLERMLQISERISSAVSITDSNDSAMVSFSET